MALRDLGLLTLICLVWAGNSVMSKVLITHFGAPPLFYAAARFGVIFSVNSASSSDRPARSPTANGPMG